MRNSEQIMRYVSEKDIIFFMFTIVGDGKKRSIRTVQFVVVMNMEKGQLIVFKNYI